MRKACYSIINRDFLSQQAPLSLQHHIKKEIKMNKIGVFYGSTTGTTEDVARQIAEKLNVPSGHIYDVSNRMIGMME